METQKHEIESHLNNPDIINIAYKAASSFIGKLSKDEIQNCVVTAIWRSMSEFDPTRGLKFSSYVYKAVLYECLSQRKLNRYKYPGLLDRDVVDQYNPIEKIDMIDTIRGKCDDPDLIIDRFYHNMSIRELARARNVCGETIRIRIGKNLKKLKSELKKVYYI
jgi:DNA-directed RNA polymerase specialized sigma24 family protein